ncbi:COBW domain-containing protein 1 isoform X2 [Triticum urartu]|uniref:CobW C-terminal domain-containing protein n=1 Tax=Triticum urartu TaxID=4572 RepID=A0A8R7PCK8_TRIUA|nr:COBW domain-containing protein 1 isoform X2 [Triticum urartu]
MEVGDDDCPPLAVELPPQTASPPFPASSSASASAPVGVTVITGYLGAGKSTLVNYILSGQHGKRIAVILNEFGEEIGVERAMINEGQGGAVVEEWVELANGCVCCTVKHSLVQALEQLVQTKERMDHILLETTGLADPAPLVSILWLDDQLESSIRLDSIITVIDAKNFRRQIDEHMNSSSFPEAFHQIAFADVVILNKIDLVKDDLEDLERQIHDVNALVTVVRSVRCQVDLNTIFDRQAYGVKNSSQLQELLEYSKSAPPNSRHDNSISTLCIYEQDPVCLAKVESWLEDLLWEKKSNMDIYRCKGILNIHDSNQLHTLQAVREVYEVVPAREWSETQSRMNKIVFIGRDLDISILQDSFSRCKH